MTISDLVPDIRTLSDRLAEVGYLTDAGLAAALFCAVRLPQPLLLEGEAGVGKTQAAKALAELLGTPLIRLHPSWSTCCRRPPLVPLGSGTL